ncbi:hypothetical protein SLS57_003737 [Botryosphaeria dothidea]
MIKDPTDERSHRKTRILSTVAAVVVALAAGTNYAYSAWAPQFADRLRLTATQSNLIGAAGNIGMYATGIPVGMLVDSKGPRPAAFLGATLLFLGYFPLQKALRATTQKQCWTENEVPDAPDNEASESSSLISEPGDLPPKPTASHDDEHDSHRPDISGIRLLRTLECWQLFIVLGLLTGIGLMTINNIGHDAQALWSHYDDSVSKGFIGAKQLAQVSIISIGSFLGRLASGIGSDALVKKLNMSRFWCLVVSALIFTLAQFTAMRVENPNHLWLVSSLTGLGYGALFGVFPSIVADAFGVHVMTQNWGFMTLSPVISGNVFNLCYGSIFDAHSTPLDGGDRECTEGLSCYSSAYGITLVASILGVFLILWTMRHERAVKRKEMEERNSHNA